MLQVLPHRRASQNPNRSSSSSSSERGGVMISGTPGHLGAKIHGENGMTRHPYSIWTEHSDMFDAHIAFPSSANALASSAFRSKGLDHKRWQSLCGLRGGVDTTRLVMALFPRLLTNTKHRTWWF